MRVGHDDDALAVDSSLGTVDEVRQIGCDGVLRDRSRVHMYVRARSTEKERKQQWTGVCLDLQFPARLDMGGHLGCMW